MSLNHTIWPLRELPGLQEPQLTQLRELGIETTEDLITLGRSPQGLQQLSRRLSIPLKYPQKWMALAELSQIPSVGCQYCGLLLHSGVASVAQLAAIAPGRLYSQIRKLHTMTLKRSDLCPTPDRVVQWVTEAKRIRR